MGTNYDIGSSSDEWSVVPAQPQVKGYYVPKMSASIEENFSQVTNYSPFDLLTGNFYHLQAQLAASIDGNGEPYNSDEKIVLGMMQVMLEEKAITQQGYDRIRLKLMNLDIVSQANFHNQCTGIITRALALKREGDTFRANHILKDALIEMAAIGDIYVKKIALRAIQMLKIDAGIDTELVSSYMKKIDQPTDNTTGEIRNA